jgi:glucuronosyltransferase
VTVITPMPRDVDHVHQITSSLSVDYFDNLVKNSRLIKQRGVVADETTVTKDNYMGLVNMVVEEMNSENVTRLVQNKDNRFDLVVCEAYISYILIFGEIYDAPVIQFSSGYGLPENFEIVGGESVRDHIKHPNIWRSDFSQPHFDQMMRESYLKYEWTLLEKEQEKMLKREYGVNTLMHNLKSRVLMLFVNVAAVFDNNRSVPNSVQYLGGLHLKKPRPVREESLSRFLNRYETVVYASFGSGIDSLNMDRALLAEFVRVFTSLPYGVLWKIDEPVHTMFNLTANVHTSSWFPQRDVLNHPNVKVFITQGGVQSTDEAVDSGVPLIGIPMMGDQFYNVKRYTDLGVGLNIDILNLEKEHLDRKIVQVVSHEIYSDNVYRLRQLIADVPMKPLRKALWYTKYVIRNREVLLRKCTKGYRLSFF